MRVAINAHLLAFSADYRQAGLSRYIYEMVRLLPGAMPGDRFTAFVGNAPVPPDFAAALPPNLRLSPSRFPTQRAPVRIAWEQLVLPFAARRSRSGVLFCPVNVRPVVSPCPTVVTIHDVIFLRYPKAFHPLKRMYLTAMTGWSARHAARVVTVSEATRQDVIDLLGVAPERVTTVHNGVSEQFRPVAHQAKREFLARQGVEGRVVLYVGTLEPRKNLTVLLQSFASVASKPGMEDVTLIIGGSKGWYYDEVFATAERLGLGTSGRVRFLGRVPDDDLPLWYNVATVFAYPSLYEGFGLPALEAMACGTPVVVSTTPALREVVSESGLTVDPHDTAGWAAALERLLAGGPEAERLREMGPRRASLFTWERSAAATARVLAEAAQQGKRRSTLTKGRRART
ncbi:MAG TPA: glycosyltransferase family 1 protein [Chloroflexia bacterium]|nr:glycosyltransferase family 1 protein [Chloroflexia bacterium]